MRTRETDIRKFKRQLRTMGYEPTRTHGSHEIWVNKKGKVFSFPAGAKTIKAGIVWQFNRENSTKESQKGTNNKK